MKDNVLKKMLSQNVGIKAVSLIIAGILWFIVMGERGTELHITIPLELVNKPSDLVIVGDIPDEVSLRVLGPSTMVRTIASQGLRYIIDLADVKEGIADFTILPTRVKLPRGLTVTRVSPASIAMNFERIESKTVRINPVVQGTPLAGFSLVDLKVSPAEIKISGAKSQVHLLQEVSTAPVDISPYKGNVSLDVGLDLGGMDVWQDDPKERVKLSFRIEEKVTSRTFKGFPVAVTSPKGKYEVEPERIDIEVHGPFTKVDALRPQDIQVVIDLSTLKAGTYTLPAKILLPEDIVLAEASPKKFHVQLWKTEYQP